MVPRWLFHDWHKFLCTRQKEGEDKQIDATLKGVRAQPFKGLSPKALPSNLHLYLMGHNVSDGPPVSETSGECSFFFSWVHYSLPLKRPGIGQ